MLAAAALAVLPGSAGADTQAPARNVLHAGLVFSGSETIMSGFVAAMLAQLDPAAVRPLYLRPSVLPVRPGDPDRISGLRDLLKPGHRILVVAGAGQQGLWEDVAGRLGDMETLRSFRASIAAYAASSAAATHLWMTDRTLDAWLIWQFADPTLADQVAIEPEYPDLAGYRHWLDAQGRASAGRSQVRRVLPAPALRSSEGRAGACRRH